MINNSVNPSQIADDSAASVRTATRSTPHPVAPKTAQPTSLGHRLQRALTGGSERRWPGLPRLSGGATSPSLSINRRLSFPILALLALLAASLLFLLPGGPVQAQDASIDYPENGADPVATFTAVDPEGRTVYWDLVSATGFTAIDVNGNGETDDAGDIVADDVADAGDFSISMDGVLNFKSPPSFESPNGAQTDADESTPADGSNTYNVVVVSSDDAPGAGNMIMMAYHKVTVMVTDVDEDGSISLSTLQPQVGVPLTATLTDQDARSVATNPITNAVWKWEQAPAMDGPWTLIPGAGDDATPASDSAKAMDNYVPVKEIAGMYLRATVTYTDKHGDDKTAMAVSAHMVRAKPTGTNSVPSFPNTNAAQTREVDENSPPGTVVGKPVKASDTPGEILTYTLNGDDGSSFDINPATGQIMVGARTTLDEETTGSYSVEVTATDPWGMATADAVAVTITINDVNEAPTITAGATRVGVDEKTAIAEAVDTYMATDVDQAIADTPVIWSVSGTDVGDFDISNETATLGELTFKKIPNYEMPADSNGDNIYMVTVVATDAGVDSKNKMIAERAVIVTVKNVDEDGTVAYSSVQPKDRIPFAASLTDPDGMTTDVKWQWWKTTATDATTVPDFTADDGTRAIGWEKIDDAKTDSYTPVSGDIDRWLAAVATYTDPTGPGQIAQKDADTSDNMVIVNNDNVAPEFREGGEKPVTQATRYIEENSDASDPIVANSDGMTDNSAIPDPDPVMATDPNDRPGVAEDDSEGKLTHTLGGSDMDSFEIVPATGQITVAEDTKLDYESNKKSYMVTVTATDPSEAMTTIDVTIMVVDVNEGPEFTKPSEGDVDVTVQENTRNLNIYTFQARDPEGRKVSWSLRDDASDSPDGAHFTITDRGVLSLETSPNYEDETGLGPDKEYKVQVVASDDALGAGITTEDPIMTSMKTVTVTVTDVEEVGAITWTPKYPHVGEAVVADLTDGDGLPTITWEWTVSSGNPAGTGADSTSYTPAEGDVDKTLRVKATYEENNDDKTVGPISVGRVRQVPSSPANVGPVFDPITANRKVAENARVGTRLGDAVRATDADSLTYTVNDTNNFSVSSSGQLSTAAMLNHEEDDEHTVTVTATDPWGVSAIVTYTVTVEDVNEAPMISTGPTRRDHEENTAVDVSAPIADYEAADIDADDTSTELTWSLEGEDAAKFDLTEDDGELTFKESPNFEMPTDRNKDNVYKVTVVVSDDGTPKLMDKRQVEITVTDDGEDGVVTLSAVQPKTGIGLMASLTDPDNVTSTNADGSIDTGITWQWWRTVAGVGDVPTFLTAASAPETGTWEKIPGAKSDTYKPVSGDIGRWLTARATYSDRDGAGKTMYKSSANAVINNNDNVGPVFKDDNGDEITETTRKVREDAVPNVPDDDETTGNIDESMQVGEAVIATDDNAADLLTYTLSNPDAALFDITDDTNSTRGGLISLKTGVKLDYEDKNTYMVKVTAADPDGEMASVDVTIKVTDVDEKPKITVGGLAISAGPTNPDHPENSTASVGTYTVVGSMKDSASWTLTGNDASHFMVQPATGMSVMLMFKTAPDHEMPGDANMDNYYMVTLNAVDSEGNVATPKAVKVRVTNMEEDGTVTLSSTAPAVGTALTASVTDLDGGVTGTTWQWARSPDMAAWTDIPGATSDSYTPVEADVSMYLRAMASYTDAEGSDKSAQKVSANPVPTVAGDPLLERYDADNNGKINLDEALAAVADYFVIARSAAATDQEKQDAEVEVLEVVARFFRDSRES